MRIAFIAPFGLRPKGTVSARMLPLAHALAGRGHQVRVVVPPWDDPAALRSPRTLVEQHGPSGASVQLVTLQLPRKAPYSIALTYGLVREALRPFSDGARPDAVHVFKPVGYSGLAGFALSAMRVPWVLDTDDWEGPGGWAGVNPYSRAQRLALTVQEATLPRLARAVTAASRALEARAWSYGLPRSTAFYLPNGVWAARYASWVPDPALVAKLRTRYGLAGKPVLLLYTRFAEFPLQWPLDVLQSVLVRHPDARLLVVGSGFFAEEEKLAAMAAERGLGERVITVGYLPEAQLPSYLALGDVALYPMEDNLINRAKSPVKVLEPMVMGLPMVAHRVGEVAEFLGDCGVLVPPSDLDEMAAGASLLLADPGLRNTLATRASERVWANFNWETISLSAEAAYKKARGLDQT
jgi:glycosyltransferase involved in cell wall biosynthesis